MIAPKERTIGPGQFLTIIAVMVVFFLSWDFGNRVLATMNLLQQDTQADAQLRQLEQQNADLNKLKTQVTTDGWVEDRARNEWHWTKEGETIFVPISTPAAPLSPPVPATPPPLPAKPGWQQMLDSLINAIFGPAPRT